MSELLLLKKMQKEIGKGRRIDIENIIGKMIEAGLDNSIINPDFVFSIINFMILRHKLITHRDEYGSLFVEEIHEEAFIMKSTHLLIETFIHARDIEEFKELIFKSPLNNHFIDEREINGVYKYLLNNKGEFIEQT